MRLINIHESISTRLWESTWVSTMVVWSAAEQLGTSCLQFAFCGQHGWFWILWSMSGFNIPVISLVLLGEGGIAMLRAASSPFPNPMQRLITVHTGGWSHKTWLSQRSCHWWMVTDRGCWPVIRLMGLICNLVLPTDLQHVCSTCMRN